MANFLILEDDYELASSWRKVFESRGHTVDLSFGSSEAIALLQSRTYDFYIVDLHIPSFKEHRDSGQKLLIELKTVITRKGIGDCVIGTSGVKVSASFDAAKLLFHSYGVKEFIAKPFTPDTLADLAESMLPLPNDAAPSTLMPDS